MKTIIDDIQAIANDSSKKIILINLPRHNNLGDCCIGWGEIQLLEEFSPFPLYGLTDGYLASFGNKKKLPNIIKKDDIILLHGGGHFGDLYQIFMNTIFYILSTFKYNKIILLPQTFYVKENQQEFFNKLKLSLTNNKDVTLLLREQYSYDIVSNELQNITNVQVKLCIDSAIFYQTELKPHKESNQILLCLRRDREGFGWPEELIKSIKKDFNIIFEDSMGSNIRTFESSKEILDNKLTKFKNANLIITDRLHGMIFAYLTNTPCIALDNLTNKSRHFYDTWLCGSPLIKFCDRDSLSLEDINDMINKTNNFKLNINESFIGELND